MKQNENGNFNYSDGTLNFEPTLASSENYDILKDVLAAAMKPPATKETMILLSLTRIK